MAAADPTLSSTEWHAVTVALRDAERCGCASRQDAGNGPLARLARWLTGSRPPRPLADPRLEVLRRFVCAARRQGDRARDLVPELLAFGYTAGQVEALRRVAA